MKKIAILTSGGDASTMNKCISSFATYAEKFNLEIYLVYAGFKGLVRNAIYKANNSEIKTWYNLPGTKILSARFMEFAEQENVDKAIDNLNQLGIDTLIVIGGDGSYKGALRLHQSGFNVIGLPGTIDNDITSTKYTIGFDTALNNIVTRINEIKSCMTSHRDTAMIEIMGRHCTDLTVYAGLATEANILITNENILSPSELLEKIQFIRKTNKSGLIVLVTENLLGKNGIPSLEEYKQYIESNSRELIKINVLGYGQRGGSPSAMDLVRATQMVYKACECIQNNEYGKIIGLDESENAIAYEIEEAVNKKQDSNNAQIINKFFN
ncbi:ATP-dependent 6-phosphofructokinase [Malacoplasma muris]|uniref:ATP-dependent 6-phosphofructokinase n=1 Tax=Malacoplasma muris TaxID=2119 RepID=UPI00398F2B8A